MRNKEKIKTNWDLMKFRPPWGLISSAELARVLNVPLPTINTWKVRGYLPAPVSHPKLKGNRNRFYIAQVRSVLEDRPEEDICWEFVRNHIPFDIASLKQAEYVVNNAYRLLNLEKTTIPAPF